MTTLQKIDSADNLIPNGQFCEGLAYWEEDPAVRFRFMQHLQFFDDHEGLSSLRVGEPKYGLFSRETCWCWLNRNDLFTYPIWQYRYGFQAIPIDGQRLLVSKVRADDFMVEGVDWATVYDATLDTDGNLSIVIERSVLIPQGARLTWLKPNGLYMTLVVDSEGAPAGDYRTFLVHKADSSSIASAEVGDGISTINFWVKKIVEKGATISLIDTLADTASGYYTAEDPSENEITLFKQGANLQIKAQPGDIEGIVYEYIQNSTVMRLRVFGDLAALGVVVGDFFVMTRPDRAYGRIGSISTQLDGSLEIYVEITKAPVPTGSGVFVAATDWVISPRVYCDLEIPIPGVQYELTLVLTHQSSFTWIPYLDFVTEEGASVNERRIIDSFRADLTHYFPVAEGSSFTRRIYRISSRRPLPTPGLPRIRLAKDAFSDCKIADIALFRGNLTSVELSQGSSPDFDEILYTGSPDGGLIPKGTIVPFVGGASCPPGWREVVGHPGDTSGQLDPGTGQPNTVPPGSVEFEFPDFDFSAIRYNSEKDITTIRFEEATWDLSKDGFSSYPWSSYKTLMAVVMRPPPQPPVYRFRIRINGYTRTLFRFHLPAPPPRPQRYEYVEVGMLKPVTGSALILQVVPNAKDNTFETREYPYRPNAMYNILIADVRVMGDYVAYERGSEADPTAFRATYPSGYNNLYNELNFNLAAPTPDGITTAIRLTRALFEEIKRVVLYDPRRLGEPLPAVDARPVGESGTRVTEIDLVGDWTNALSHLFQRKARIIRAGYVKADSESPGLSGLGSDQHNHAVTTASISPISAVAAKVSALGTDEPNRPPVLSNHGHGYLGAGGYSRPFARAVKMCEKL